MLENNYKKVRPTYRKQIAAALDEQRDRRKTIRWSINWQEENEINKEIGLNVANDINQKVHSGEWTSIWVKGDFQRGACWCMVEGRWKSRRSLAAALHSLVQVFKNSLRTKWRKWTYQVVQQILAALAVLVRLEHLAEQVYPENLDHLYYLAVLLALNNTREWCC